MTVRALHVAILDDDPSIRTALVRLLKSAQMTADAYATSGELFESVARKCPDSLLLDLDMPEMSGLEVLERLDARQIRIPTIVITGSDGAAFQSACLSAGAKGYLSKPIDALRLIEMIHEVSGAPCSDVPASAD